MSRFAAILAVGFVACLVAAALADVDNEFTMQVKGSCTQKGTQCISKGNSQQIVVSIDPDDAMEFSVTSHLGSYATIRSVAEYDDKLGVFAEQGNMTFGTHLLQSHTLYYNSLGKTGRKEYVKEKGTGEFVYSMTAVIQGGTGAFDGAQGMMSVTGYGVDADYSQFTAYVSVVTNVDL